MIDDSSESITLLYTPPTPIACTHLNPISTGHTQDLEVTLATCPAHTVSPLAPRELESLCDMACEWCLLLASGR